MDVIKVNKLHGVGDLEQGCLVVSDVNKLNVLLDKVITYTNPSLPVGKITFAEHNPVCHPKKEPLGKSAEEMLKKALEYANQGMDENSHCEYISDEYAEGKYYVYEDMAARLEMLIKEAKNA